MLKRRISVQLTAGFLAITLLTLGVLGTLFVHQFRQYALDSRRDTLLQRGQSISAMISDLNRSGSVMRGMGGFLRFLGTMTDAEVWIVDAEGNPLAIGGMGGGHGMMTEAVPESALPVLQQVLVGETVSAETQVPGTQDPGLLVGVPILTEDGGVTGAVLLDSQVTGVGQALGQVYGILGFSAVISLAVAAAAGSFYALRFVKPLKRLSDGALLMASGDYGTRSGILREDELGQLARSMDHMAEVLGGTIDQLYQEKTKLADLFDGISEGIVAFDSELQPVSCNWKLGALFGSEPDPCGSALRIFRELEIDQDLRRVCETKETLSLQRSYKGSVLHFKLSPVIGQDRRLTGVVSLIQDVSENERLEQLRRDFVANVSHEFRTPLTVIRGSVEALGDGVVSDPAEVRRYLERIRTETRSMERLVEDLLQLSKLQAGALELKQEPVNLKELLGDVVSGMQGLADPKSLRILIESGGEPAVTLGDYDRLRQVAVILLDNAVKFSPEGGTVTVRVLPPPHCGWEVADQGPGIPEEERAHIWDRFYQVERSRSGSGTGLGLAIAKGIVALHQGRISVEENSAGGARFRVALEPSAVK